MESFNPNMTINGNETIEQAMSITILNLLLKWNKTQSSKVCFFFWILNCIYRFIVFLK